MSIENVREALKEAGRQRIAKKTNNIYFRRSVRLIVPKVSWNNATQHGSLHNEDWAYNVGYSFRDALDIRYEQRMKDKHPYRVWTQGGIIDFREGDTLESDKEQPTIQVTEADPMRWQASCSSMDMGFVTFAHWDDIKFGAVDTPTQTLTQIQFLELLITGKGDTIKS